MSNYNEAQSTIIALWVLARRRNDNPWPWIKDNTAPETIAKLVNAVGEEHSTDSILLHTHGYDRILLNRKTEKSITGLQKSVAKQLLKDGIVESVYQMD